MYTEDGHMSAQLGCDRLPVDEIGDLETQEAVARLIRRHFSYYGSYTVDDVAQTVTHHVTGSVAASWVGTDRTRSFAFEGADRIVLTTPDTHNRLVWLRN